MGPRYNTEKARIQALYGRGRWAESVEQERLEKGLFQDLLNYNPLNAKKIKEEMIKRKK